MNKPKTSILDKSPPPIRLCQGEVANEAQVEVVNQHKSPLLIVCKILVDGQLTVSTSTHAFS